MGGVARPGLLVLGVERVMPFLTAPKQGSDCDFGWKFITLDYPGEASSRGFLLKLRFSLMRAAHGFDRRRIRS